MIGTLLLVGNKNNPQLVRLSDEIQDYEIIIEEDSDKILDDLSVNKNISCILYFISTNFSKDLKELKKIVSNTVIPIITLSTLLDDKQQSEFLQTGISDYTFDSINSKVLQQKIANIVKINQAVISVHKLERDDLTGLYTRQAFLQRARTFIDKNSASDLLIIATDFPNFKFMNIQFGETKCDEFLAAVGKKLLELDSRYMGCRYSGDQFVLLVKTSRKLNLKYIQKVIEEKLTDMPIPDVKIKIGVYEITDKSIPVITCCDRAFLAIRQIKGIYNKDIVLYEESFTEKLNAEQKIIDSMETALKENQFMVYYQPKHETVNGKIAGCEALVRWNHPEYGFMNPGQFIPLFERNGFITKLDSFVVNRVCEDIQRWAEQGIPAVPISINVSRRDYLEPNWMKNQVALIDSYKINHSLIHFEVTESLYTEYTDLIIEQVRQVQMQNFLIEMDDFGSGYSSLGLLSTFPLNVIKLDISFVRNIKTNEIVIENIIKMAHKMGLSVVAEGAETQEQFKTLKSLGCDLIQGYCFSKPLSCTDYEAYLLKQNISSNKTLSSVLPAMKSEEDKYSANEVLLKVASEIGDSIPGGFISYHADGNEEIISFNEEVLKIFECETSEEFRAYTKNSFTTFVHPDDIERVEREIKEQITDENDIDHVKYRIITKKGNVKYIDDYGRFVHTYKYGDVFYVFLSDITDIHERHLEIQRHNEVIQGISRSFNSIYLVEFATNTMIPYAIAEKDYALMKPMFDAGLGYNEVVRTFADNYVEESEREKIKAISKIESIRKQFEDNEFYSFTFHYVNGDVRKLIELSLRKLMDDKKSERAVLAFRTVSEEMINHALDQNRELVKQLEAHKQQEKLHAEELQKAYEATETANKARGILLTQFASEIKKSIVTIRDKSRELLKNDNNEGLSLIFDDSERIVRIINNIELASKLDSNEERKTDIKPTDCSPAIERIRLNISEAAEKKHIKVETWNKFYNPMIYQDLDKTAQISISIINNAIKYTPEGGTIQFGLEQIPGDKPDECKIIFVCRDTGIGISKEFLPHVYEIYNREDNEINQKEPSAGLGLYIAKKLVDSLNGTIDIKSEKDKGTEVTVIFSHKYANKDEKFSEV